MRHYWIASLLTTCCLPGLPVMAQQTEISPLTPIAPAVQPPAPSLQGADVVPWPAQRTTSPSPPATTYQWSAPRPDPLYILDGQVIIDNSFLNIRPDDIEKLYVYKGGPDTPWKWRNLTQYGIIDVTLKDKSKARIKTRTLAEIGKWLQISGSVSYAINGMPVGEADLRIATVAIAEVQVTRPTATLPTARVNIQIAHHTPPPSAPDPSGKPRIMIRGTASL